MKFLLTAFLCLVAATGFGAVSSPGIKATNAPFIDGVLITDALNVYWGVSTNLRVGATNAIGAISGQGSNTTIRGLFLPNLTTGYPLYVDASGFITNRSTLQFQPSNNIITLLAGVTATNKFVFTNDIALTNRMVVAAGSGGVTVDAAGANGVMTFTVNAGGGGGSSALTNGGTLRVDIVAGNDTTGTRNREDKPYATITNAVLAASAGDTIVVMPGRYTNQFVRLKDRVNFYFMPGSIVTNVTDTSQSSRAMFEDYNTAVDVSIDGFGDFYMNGTDDENTGSPILKVSAVLFLQQESNVRFKGRKIHGFVDGDCAVLSLLKGTSSFYFDEFRVEGTVGKLFYLQNNNLSCFIRRTYSTTPGYGLRALDAVSGGGTNTFYYEGDYWESRGPCFSTQCETDFNGVGHNPRFKLIVRVKDVVCSGVAFIGAESSGAAFRTDGGVLVADCQNIYGWSQVGHMVAQKNGTANAAQGGMLDVRALRYFLNGVTNVVRAAFQNDNTNGAFEVFGGRFNAPKTNYMGGFWHNAGTSYVHNVIFDMNLQTNVNTNAPIVANANGLFVDSCTLLSATNGPSIYAPSPFTVTLDGGYAANANQGANVTLGVRTNFLGTVNAQGKLIVASDAQIGGTMFVANLMTLDGGAIINSSATLNGENIFNGFTATAAAGFASYIDLAEIAAPATPASGAGRLYAKSDGKLYWKDDGGTEVDLTLGASGGEVNVNGEISVTNATRFGLVYGKAGITNLLRSIEASTGITIVNNGTNLLISSTASGTPGGSSSMIQFNQGGAFAGTNDLQFDRTNRYLMLLGSMGIGFPTSGVGPPGASLHVTNSSQPAIFVEGTLTRMAVRQTSVGSEVGPGTTNWDLVVHGKSIVTVSTNGFVPSAGGRSNYVWLGTYDNPFASNVVQHLLVLTNLNIPGLTASRVAVISAEKSVTNAANVDLTELDLLNNMIGFSGTGTHFAATNAPTLFGLIAKTNLTIDATALSGGPSPVLKLIHTNGTSFTSFTVPGDWKPTNQFIFSVTNVAAGDVLKVQAVANSGGVISITLTNGTDSTGSSTTNNVVQAVNWLSLSNAVLRVTTNAGSVTAATFDWGTPHDFIVQPSGNFTLSFGNSPAAGTRAQSALVAIYHTNKTDNTPFTVTWPSGVDWRGSAPGLVLGTTNLFSFLFDGTNIFGTAFQEITDGTGFTVLSNAPTIWKPIFATNATIQASAGGGGAPSLRLVNTNQNSYLEFTLLDHWKPTNQFVLTVTNVAAGEVLKVQAVSVSGGVATILLTNGVDNNSGGGGGPFQTSQFDASGSVTNIKKLANLTNIINWDGTYFASNIYVTNQIVFEPQTINGGAAATNLDFNLKALYNSTNVLAANTTYAISNAIGGISAGMFVRGAAASDYTVAFTAAGGATITWLSPTNGSSAFTAASNRLYYVTFIVGATNGTSTNVIASWGSDNPNPIKGAAVVVAAGSSPTNAFIGGVVFVSTTAYTNLNGANTLSNAASMTIPAHMLTNNMDSFRWEAGGKMLSGTNDIAAILGSTTVMDTGSVTNLANSWRAFGTVTRTGNTSQHVESTFFWGDNAAVAAGIYVGGAYTNYNAEIAETNGIDTTFKIQVAGKGLGHVTNNYFKVWYEPSPR